MLPCARSHLKFHCYCPAALCHLPPPPTPPCVLESFPCCCLCASLKPREGKLFRTLTFSAVFSHFPLLRFPQSFDSCCYTYILSYCQQRKRDSECSQTERGRERASERSARAVATAFSLATFLQPQLYGLFVFDAQILYI